MARTKIMQYTLVDLFHFMESGRLTVPYFQRGYVWSNEAVRQLFDSVNRGFPIGMLIAVELGADHFKMASQEVSLFPPPSTQSTAHLRRLWLIDGSQRMAALYNGLFESQKRFRLLYDLKSHEFFFFGESRERGAMLEMSSLFNSKVLMSFQAELAREAQAETLIAELNAMRERFYSYAVPMLIMSDLQTSELVEAFARLNSSGLSLTKEELERAMRVVRTKSHSVRERPTNDSNATSD